MKRIFLLPLLAIVLGFCMQAQENQSPNKKYQVFGIVFYNLENLFDRITVSGTLLEDTPLTKRFHFL